MRSARYVVVTAESSPGQLVLRDLGPWDQFPTITNRAEEVVEELVRAGLLPPGRALLYYDSTGQLDEIVHQDGRFHGFRPYSPKSQEEETDGTADAEK